MCLFLFVFRFKVLSSTEHLQNSLLSQSTICLVRTLCSLSHWPLFAQQGLGHPGSSNFHWLLHGVMSHPPHSVLYCLQARKYFVLHPTLSFLHAICYLQCGDITDCSATKQPHDYHHCLYDQGHVVHYYLTSFPPLLLVTGGMSHGPFPIFFH